MEDGERDFVFNRGADGQLSRDETETIPLDEVGIIHFGSATGFLPGPLQAAYQGMLQKALLQNTYFYQLRSQLSSPAFPERYSDVY